MSGEVRSGTRVGQAAVWTIGVLMIGVGLLGMAGGAGVPWLVGGILVTPKTRDEVFELCSIWVESRDGR